MATTDTRSGFRLPWSSDRNHDAAPADETAEAAADAVPGETPGAPVPWPTADVAAQHDPAPVDPSPDPAPVAEESVMLDLQPSPATPAAAPRKPSKLMADLSAAIRSTADAARDQALAQVEADAAGVVEAIRAGSKDGEADLRAKSDQDIAGIKEWSRAEIARIKEETERRIEARKLGLDEELAAHAAAIEHRVGAVESTVAAYRAEMEGYAERLGQEDDPARLATLAETMPEPPALEGWTDLSDLPAVAVPPAEDADFPEDVIAARLAGVAIPSEPEPVVAETAVVAEPEAVEAEAGGWADAAWTDPAVHVAEDAAAVVEPVEAATWAAPEPAALEPESHVAAQPPTTGTSRTAGWGEHDAVWAAPAAVGVAEQGTSAWQTEAETPRGDDGELMAALEADAATVMDDAMAVVDEASAVADPDGAEAMDASGELDAAAALAARLGAGQFEESFADRLASLVPASDPEEAAAEAAVTQVVVSGLVSVASIASFKRHLGRLAGVTAVAVASGPDGEFVFNVTHRSDVSLRDAIPTLPGFAARVTGAEDGIVQVTARDPEAEG